MTGMHQSIRELNRLGQSIWYDNLSRDVLRSGRLAALVEMGVSGLTSNPTIFKKAIADTGDYDDDIRRLAAQGLSTEQICEELMFADVLSAADLLRPVYSASQGADGYASIEISPFLARDNAATFAAAKRIFERLGRENIMIKIPGTPECLGAVRIALEAGVNVNVTLLFDVQIYVKVVEQYLLALENRAAMGKRVNGVASVASFFVSRVDAICEQRFDALQKAGRAAAEDRVIFFGKAGVANAKLAYEQFSLLFSSKRFDALRRSGARVQRPLWASTGTKNPALNPLLYVEELAGADTVNTVPPATLERLLQEIKVRPALTDGVEEAREVIRQTNVSGLPFSELMTELQQAGVKLFETSYRDLLASIEAKRRTLSP